MSATTNCRVCREVIASDAKRCPKCRSWQSGWRALWSPSTPQSLGYQLVVTVVIIALMIPLMKYVFFSGGKDFEDYRDKLQLETPSISFTKADKRDLVVVVGTIKNQSDVTWRNIHVEARFLNPKGEMVDSQSYDLRDVIVRANTDAAYRVTAYAVRPASEYNRVALVITSARSKSWWYDL